MKFSRLLLGLCALTASPLYATLIPAARLTTWTPGVTVGVIGGIPTNRTHLIDVTQAPYNADKTGVADATAAIQAAINASVANDVIYLPGGTYRITGVLNFDFNKDNRTLRGAGLGVTNIDCRAPSIGIHVGVNSFGPTTPITAGLAKDSTQITIADTSSYFVGQMIEIAIANDPSIPVLHVAGFPNSRIQTTRVTAKTGTTLSFFPGLYGDYSTVTAQVSGQLYQTDGVGIEDMSIDCSNGTAIYGVQFEQCYGSWIKNVRVRHSSNYEIFLINSLNCEVRHCYMDELLHTGTNGAGLLFNTNSACLIEDNILVRSFPIMEINFSACGNVFAYNFCEDSSVFGVVGSAINTNHGPHNSYNLYEGNISPNIQADGYFGSASTDTIFRNWLHGTNPGNINREPLLLDRFTRDYTVIANLLGTAGIPYKNINGTVVTTPYALGLPNVGNASFLGTAQPSLGSVWPDFNIHGSLSTRTDISTGTVTTSGGNGSLTTASTQVGMTWAGGIRSNITITAVGANSVSFSGGTGADLPTAGTAIQIWAGVGGYQEKDLDVQATTILKANYDVFTGIIPVAEVAALGADTLPASLYRSAKPAWFGATQTWPAFNPSAPNAAIVAGTVASGYPVGYTTIPAGFRYVNGNDPPITPYFLAQPTGATIPVGATLTLSTVFDGYPTPTFQWNKGGVPIPGATSSTLAIPGAVIGDTGTYTLTLTNGSGTATSNGATMTVTNQAFITTQPIGQTVTQGATVTLITAANGIPTPTFQWQRNGVNLSNGGVIAGATSSTLVLTGVGAANAGTYTVVATNTLGSDTSTGAVLVVNTYPVFTTQPLSQSVALGGTAVFTVAANGSPAPTFQWQKDGVNIAGQTTTTLTLPSITLASTGIYTCVATNAAGPISSNGAGLNTSSSPPGAISQPVGTTILSGTSTSLTFTVSGTPSPSIQWYRNGVAIPGATSSTLFLNAATKAANGGSYYATAINGTGSITSNTVVLTVQVPSRLVNVATRALAGTGTQSLIAGFVLSGGNKLILGRAIGPGIATFFPVGATLADPTLTVLDGQTVVATNDDWGGTTALKTVFTQVGAGSLADNSKDAALVGTLLAGKIYSAVVGGAGGGLSVVEIYDADPSETPAGKIINLSTRTQVGTDTGVLIAGFVIAGDFPKQVLIRAVGPTLSGFGVPGALVDPKLELYVAGGASPINTNDNWGGGATLTNAFNAVGAFALPDANSKDAVLLVTLNPGVYSAIVSGVGNTTGVALVEVYDVP